MKKKLFSFLFAFALIVTGAVCLTACGEEPEFDKLVVSVNNTEHENFYSFGDFEYGTTPNLTYKVYAKYSDGSKKELSSSDYTTEYRYNEQTIAALPSTYEIGAYAINIVYKEYNFPLSFNVVYAKRTYQTVLTPNKTQWAYGEEQPEVKINDNTITLEDGDFYYIEKSQVSDPSNLTLEEFSNASLYNKESALVPGQYYLFAKVPQNGNYAESYSTLKEVSVSKMNLVVENAETLKVTFDYNDSGVIGNFVLGEKLDCPTMTIKTQTGEVYGGLNASFAQPNLQLNSTNNGDKLIVNFAFENADDERLYNLPSPVEVALEVIQGKLQKPTVTKNINNVTISVTGNGVNDSYKWMPYALTLTNPDTSTAPIDINDKTDREFTLTAPTEAGTYTYTFTIKDTTNYTWEDDSTAPVIGQITIE